ncbi:threonine-phosphate decarboxylase [Acetobacter sp. LMG 1627]|uniref:threonine-phosphate decarboxylase n=2 Tax=Acetobacter conturbans TaxID=1737472 RepID=A0ABX0K894_9PROT|nr:threonine-phosphate decarboxylase [Acetobacter conturbans]
MTATVPTRLPPHGGNLAAIRERFPDAVTPLIDLSTGISPFPYPFQMSDPTLLTRLPEPEAEYNLRRIAAEAYGATDADMLVATPGTQLAIGTLPLVLGLERARILGPAYTGHAEAWSACGRIVEPVTDIGALFDAPPRTACVVINPNNPDGRLLDVSLLSNLAKQCAKKGNILIVDEAFGDWNETSMIPALPQPGLIVLRSFGKAYGLAGLRLGFVVANREFSEKLRKILGSWAVSGPALACGAQALSDRRWHKETGAKLLQSTERLHTLIKKQRWSIAGGTRLFTLVNVPNAHQVWETLCRTGIVTRAFHERPNQLRFGLPSDENQWKKLEESLPLCS